MYPLVKQAIRGCGVATLGFALSPLAFGRAAKPHRYELGVHAEVVGVWMCQRITVRQTGAEVLRHAWPDAQGHLQLEARA